jgi:hypothetical protein
MASRTIESNARETAGRREANGWRDENSVPKGKTLVGAGDEKEQCARS